MCIKDSEQVAVVNGTVKRQDVFTLHNDVFFAATNAMAPFRRKRPGGDEDRAGQRQPHRLAAINNTLCFMATHGTLWCHKHTQCL